MSGMIMLSRNRFRRKLSPVSLGLNGRLLAMARTMNFSRTGRDRGEGKRMEMEGVR
jgi:hypothetical protein